MASNNFYASSPTVVLPPNLVPDQYFASSHYAGPINTNQNVGNFSTPLFTPNGSTIAMTPGSLAGRKRSRGDIHSPDEELESTLEEGSKPLQAPSPPKPLGEPLMGPGMSLVYPNNPAYQFVAESQSGTWVEEQSERKVFELAHLRRPSVASRKSQRLDPRAAGPDDLAQLVLPHDMRDVTSEPLIDEATRALGISWTRMDKTEALRIGQAAYTKWIQNHYASLKDVNVWFENSAIPGYLVAARNVYNGLQEFYIFSNDLTEARLVTSEPSQLLPRLNMLPALHLAAPGGCIRAETDPITASQNAVDNTLQASLATDDTSVTNGMCSAHAMEMD